MYYLPEWKGEAKSDRKRLAKYYNVSENDIGMAVINTSDDFKKYWNMMGPDNGNNISAVIINTHGSEKGLLNSERQYIIETQDIAKLNNKNIDNLILYGCNVGHLDHIPNNPASQFAQIINGGKVLASDGTVKSSWFFDFSYKSKYSESFKRKLLNGIRDNKGWVIYQEVGGTIITTPIKQKNLLPDAMLNSMKGK